jgi:chemotaxis protein CheX
MTALQFLAPVKRAAQEVLEKTLPDTVVWGEAHLAGADALEASEMVVSVGFHGDLVGSIAFGFDPATARYVAGTLLGEEISQMDDLAKSALRELANMVAGTARLYLNKHGVWSDISTPVLSEGGMRSPAWDSEQPVTVDLTLKHGAIRLMIGIQHKRSLRV